MCKTRGENNLASMYLLLIDEEYRNNPTTRRVEICLNLLINQGDKWATDPNIYASIIYFIHNAILTDNLDDMMTLMNIISENQFEKERESKISSMEFMCSQENIKKSYEIMKSLLSLPFDKLFSCKFINTDEQLLELKFV
jgi:hypothetical protein